MREDEKMGFRLNLMVPDSLVKALDEEVLRRKQGRASRLSRADLVREAIELLLAASARKRGK